MKITTKETQELRDKTLSELKESISSNRNILPGDFIKIWQSFEKQDKELEDKESKDWNKLRKLKLILSLMKDFNIAMLCCIYFFVLLNLGLFILYYQYRTESLETINNLRNHHEESSF